MIISIFACEGNLEKAFLEVGLSFDLSVLILDKYEKIYNEYGGYINPFYECTFSILGLQLPLNDLEVEVLNHLMNTSS